MLSVTKFTGDLKNLGGGSPNWKELFGTFHIEEMAKKNRISGEEPPKKKKVRGQENLG